MSIECRKPKTKFLQLLMKTIKKNVTSGVEYQVKNYFTDFFIFNIYLIPKFKLQSYLHGLGYRNKSSDCDCFSNFHQ